MSKNFNQNSEAIKIAREKAKTENIPKTEEKKKTLGEILVFAHMNAQQLCNIVPEANIITRQITSMDNQAKLNHAQARLWDTKHRELKGHVDYLELLVRKKDAIRLIEGEEAVDRERIRKVLEDVCEQIIVPEKEIKSGTQSEANRFFIQKMKDVFLAYNIPVPSVLETEKKKTPSVSEPVDPSQSHK